MTPIDRLLGMRLVYGRPSVARFVNFEFMNRQLVWHGFSVGYPTFPAHCGSIKRLIQRCPQEFLMFLTPLINADRIKRGIYRLFRFRNKLTTASSSAGYRSRLLPKRQMN